MAAMPLQPRDVLTPQALSMLVSIHRTGSFAAAARALDLVPSALTYRVRQIEDALDVLLFDRSSRQARLTEAGAELLQEGERLLLDLDAVANRVKRGATGWEPHFTVAIDSLISRATVLELCESFFSLKPPTRLKVREETLSGTWEALISGQCDLAVGVTLEHGTTAGIQSKPLGQVPFVYAVAPHHPLAAAPEPLPDEQLRQHRAVAVADSALRGQRLSFGLLSGQDVFTVPSMQAKLEAQLRGLGGGFLPQCLAGPYIDTGRLVAKRVERATRVVPVSYAWHSPKGGRKGRALAWWLKQLESPATRDALIERHGRL